MKNSDQSLLLRQLDLINELDKNGKLRSEVVFQKQGQIIDALLRNMEIGEINENSQKKDSTELYISDQNQIFISYSHKDEEWLVEFKKMLKPSERGGKISIWDDTKIMVGNKWRDEIALALKESQVAMLLVTPDFLASDFIAEHELPPLLNAAYNNGLRIFWVAISHCLYHETEIESYQAVNNPAMPLDGLAPSERNKEIARICRQIIATL